MIPALKSEFRKLLTVRSTYVTTFLVLALVALISIWPQGINLVGAQLNDPAQLSGDVTGMITAFSIFGGIVAILLMSHEYRYNTIMYTLTATNNRLKTLAAKFVVASAYGLVFTALLCTFAPLLSLLGVHLAGHTLVAQSIPYSSVVWQSLFEGWGMAMAGLLFAIIIRNQIGAIVTMLVFPLVFENILITLLKDNVAYLPFHALTSVTQHNNQLTAGQGALLFLCYLVIGWLVAVFLFFHRDAN